VHQAGLLDQRQEQVRVAQAVLGMPPADQRLHAVHLAAMQVHLGLVVQHDVVAVDRRPQVLQHLQPLPGRVATLTVIGREAPACLLRLIQRDVRALQQPVRLHRVLRADRDPDAGIDVQAHPVQVKGRLQGRQEPAGRGLRSNHIHAGQDDRELITTQPGQHITVAQRGLQPRPDLCQQLVPQVMTQTVVHFLEPVQVQDQQCQAVPGTGCSRVSRRS